MELVDRGRLPLGSAPKIMAGAYSCAGKKARNEDALGLRLPPRGLEATKGIAAVIADGVSAAEGGGEAARTAVTSFLSDYYSTPQTWGVDTAAQKVIGAINHWLLGRGRDYRDAGKGFVCTFTALVLKSRFGYLFHVGDARLYRLRGRVLERLTRDHCVGNRLSGGHFLTRALGLEANLELDFQRFALEEGDLFLLLTDGIHGSLCERQLCELSLDMQREAETQAQGYPPEGWLDALSQRLVAEAERAGSEDNLSCLALSVGPLPEQTPESLISQLSGLPFPPPLIPGQTLDGLKVLRIVHESRRSQLYQVRDSETGVQYAMKTPSLNFCDDAAYIERFLMESWIGARIKHPAVLEHVQPNRPKTALYHLSEWCDGITLADWVKAKRPGFEEKLTLLGRIEQGLRACHRKDMVHRDLKPDNVLVCPDGRVKLIDFGSVLVRGLSEIHSPIMPELPLGTAEYSAPELVLYGQATVKSDLFSLAALAFELFTGAMPFGGRLAQCNDARDYGALKYVSARSLSPALPSWVDGALERALSIEPGKRFADSHEFVLALSRASADTSQEPLLIRREPALFYRRLCLAQFWLILLLLMLLVV